jgi:hypothetical protein
MTFRRPPSCSANPASSRAKDLGDRPEPGGQAAWRNGRRLGVFRSMWEQMLVRAREAGIDRVQAAVRHDDRTCIGGAAEDGADAAANDFGERGAVQIGAGGLV